MPQCINYCGSRWRYDEHVVSKLDTRTVEHVNSSSRGNARSNSRVLAIERCLLCGVLASHPLLVTKILLVVLIFPSPQVRRAGWPASDDFYDHNSSNSSSGFGGSSSNSCGGGGSLRQHSRRSRARASVSSRFSSSKKLQQLSGPSSSSEVGVRGKNRAAVDLLLPAGDEREREPDESESESSWWMMTNGWILYQVRLCSSVIVSPPPSLAHSPNEIN